MQWCIVTAKEEQRHHCCTITFEMIKEICGRERGVSPVLLWRCEYLVVCCFIKFLKYLLNIGLFLVTHCNVISPHIYCNSWSHVNSFSLSGSSIGKVWFFAMKLCSSRFLFVIPFPWSSDEWTVLWDCGMFRLWYVDILIFLYLWKWKTSATMEGKLWVLKWILPFFRFWSELWYDIIWGLERKGEDGRKVENMRL